MRIRKNLANIQMSPNKQVGKRRKEMSEDAVDINNEENEYIMANSTICNGNKRKEINDDMSNMEENNDDMTNTTICNGIMRSKREHRPAHFLLKMKSFSALAASKVERYESAVFEAGGYNWSMIVYLHGKNEVNRDKHISLYLAIAKTKELPAGWEVAVHFKFFVHDQIRDKYLVIQDVENHLKRFHPANTEWGFEELLPMDIFKDVNNGYLVDDCCAFGAELLVVQCSGNWECVSTMKAPACGTYTWKLSSFSLISQQYCDSESFTIGGKKWKLRVYPKGDSSLKNEFLSIFLFLNETGGMIPKKKWYAEYILRIKHQQFSLRREMRAATWFSELHNQWGFAEFMLLKDLKDAKQGYCLNDTVIIECEFTLLSESEHFKQ